jgi:hypothetical protein
VTKRSAVVLARTSRVAAEGPRAADTREDRDVQFLEYDDDVFL